MVHVGNSLAVPRHSHGGYVLPAPALLHMQRCRLERCRSDFQYLLRHSLTMMFASNPRNGASDWPMLCLRRCPSRFLHLDVVALDAANTVPGLNGTERRRTPVAS